MIVSGKAGGKTHQLLEAAALEKIRGGNPVILVADVQSLDYTKVGLAATLRQHGSHWRVARMWAAEIVRLPNNLEDIRGRSSMPRFYIDNLELVLARMLGCRPSDIEMVTGNIPVRTPQGRRFETMVNNPYLKP